MGYQRYQGVSRSHYSRPGIEASGDRAGGAALEETRSDFGAHGFWRQGTTALFDVFIVNLDSISYLHMIPDKDIAKAEIEKKYTYL